MSAAPEPNEKVSSKPKAAWGGHCGMAAVIKATLQARYEIQKKRSAIKTHDCQKHDG